MLRLAQRHEILLVALAGLCILLPGLWAFTLVDPWETHYGEVAREMIVRDDYVYPHWESAYFFSKPVIADQCEAYANKTP